jgi:hypothetical protein
VSEVIDLAQRRQHRLLQYQWVCPECGNEWLRVGGAVIVEGGRIVAWQGTLTCDDHPSAVIDGPLT